MTDNDIIKALECCFLSECACKDCPYSAFEICDTAKMINTVIDLINRQKAEIERLRKIIVGFIDEVGTWSNKYEVDISTIHKLPLLAKEDFNIRNKIKTEAIKEFAERFKEKSYLNDGVVYIDNLVKEMVGD